MFKVLEGEGGHLAITLLVFLIGVAMSIGHVAEGHEVIVGALASLYTLLRSKGGNNG